MIFLTLYPKRKSKLVCILYFTWHKEPLGPLQIGLTFVLKIISDLLPESVLKFEMDKPNEPLDEQRSYEIASRMLFLSARIGS